MLKIKCERIESHWRHLDKKKPWYKNMKKKTKGQHNTSMTCIEIKPEETRGS